MQQEPIHSEELILINVGYLNCPEKTAKWLFPQDLYQDLFGPVQGQLRETPT